ncbi:MAG: DUF4139 domain-containing protein [Terriglobia bacterium]
MRRIPGIDGSAVLILLTCMMASVCAAQTVETASQADRKDLSLTLYTSGSAMVRDTRGVEIPQGAVQLKFPDVAERLLPDSVQVVSMTAPAQLSVLGQTYAYGLLTPQRLLHSYAGKTVTLVVTRLKNGSEVEEPVEATLLAANPGPVWRINGRIETGLRVDHYIFPDIPANLSANRSLILLLNNEQAGEQEVRVSYFTNGLNWAANYILTVAPDWKAASLAARAMINNESGTDYPHAAIQLVAGEVRRVNEGEGVVGGVSEGVAGGIYAMGPRPRMLMSVPQPPAQQPFSGYHLYTLQQRVDLANAASKQVALLKTAQIKITRIYEVNGQVYYNQGVEPGAMLKRPVELRVKFQNNKANSLGMPLPAGVVRVYKNDASGKQQLVGEDRAHDTAEGESLTLNLGNAFDVVEDAKQTDYQKLGPTSAESSYEITLRNHQSQPITVTVNEPFNGDWQILSSSLPYKKTSSTSAQFIVPVPANGETVLKYCVRVQWVR